MGRANDLIESLNGKSEYTETVSIQATSQKLVKIINEEIKKYSTKYSSNRSKQEQFSNSVIDNIMSILSKDELPITERVERVVHTDIQPSSSLKSVMKSVIFNNSGIGTSTENNMDENTDIGDDEGSLNTIKGGSLKDTMKSLVIDLDKSNSEEF